MNYLFNYSYLKINSNLIAYWLETENAYPSLFKKPLKILKEEVYNLHFGYFKVIKCNKLMSLGNREN